MGGLWYGLLFVLCKNLPCSAPLLQGNRQQRHHLRKTHGSGHSAKQRNGEVPKVKNMPLGYRTARSVLSLGRAALFGNELTDIPSNRSPLLQRDDLTPQFGYVGQRYARKRVLLLGINPGNGPDNLNRSAVDARMIPILVRFAQDPSPEHFLQAQRAYEAECKTWPIWRRHCAEITGAGKLALDEIAYSNCLPWRTDSQSKFDDHVAERAASLYARPLIEELQPSAVICVGKRASSIVRMAGEALPPVIVWNRAQAATAAVLAERRRAAAEVFALVGPMASSQSARLT
jgi:hypothetical protein